jgi:hypothetical protein
MFPWTVVRHRRANELLETGLADCGVEEHVIGIGSQRRDEGPKIGKIVRVAVMASPSAKAIQFG